jgi:hypothetical protein
MGEVISMVDQLNHLKSEVAALRKENELLHNWLTRQKEINSALHDMINMVHHKVTIMRSKML